jgi:NAD(P)-dependent dehydrogenase (short-subunit alcohol dehydrogenase family)
MSLRADLGGVAALVTGASGTLGGHFARLLAANGARVVLAARRTDRLHRLAAEIRAAGGEAFAVALDVTDPASIAQGFALAEDRFGPVRLLVNNAGIAGIGRPALEVDDADFAGVIDVNLGGAWRMARAAARRMVPAGGGAIVNVASILGQGVSPGVAAYAASKAALLHLTRALALEWARHAIRVNALAPGYLRTELNATFFDTEAGQRMIRRIPQRRLGEPADLDGPMLLLASDASRFMTGSVLVADGGHLLAGA